MSASTEKRMRAQARAEGTDKKTLAEKEEAAKQAKTKRRTIWAIIGVALFVAIVLFLNSTFMYKNTTALSIGDTRFSPAEVGYIYGTQYQNFASTYGDYASVFGLDTSYGISGLASQPCQMMDDENATWKDYFLQQSEENLKQLVALNRYAEENGITLSDEEKQSIDSAYTGLAETAKTNGFGSADKYISAVFGKGVTVDIARKMDTMNAIGYTAFTAYQDGIEVTDEEVEAEYPAIDVRHILIKAEADENGEYSDEAIAAAEAKAKEILDEFNKGDKTEEAFADLAEKYSEDEGSNTNGGLYEDVLQGQMVAEFNDWCFDASRKVGDTGIVHGNNGSYDGYHVMYFAGNVKPADNAAGISNVKSEKASAWVEDLTKGLDVTEGSWLNLVGKF